MTLVRITQLIKQDRRETSCLSHRRTASECL